MSGDVEPVDPAELVDPAEVEKAAAKRQYAINAAASFQAARSQRLASLKRDKPGIEEAARRFQELVTEEGTGTLDQLFVREPYFRLERDPADARTWGQPDEARAPARASDHPKVLGNAVRRDVADRPPSTSLLNRPTDAAALYLIAAGLAQVLWRDGASPDFLDRRPPIKNYHGALTWARLLGDPRRPDAVRRFLVGALKRLVKVGLVEPASGNPWIGWTLRHENGREPYKVPHQPERDAALGIDIGFWTNGWVNVLKPTETAVYLMLRDLERRVPRDAAGGVGAVDWMRRAYYGVTPEVYLATHELEEFGLIKRMPSIHNRKVGRISPEDADEVRAGTLELTVDHFICIPGGFSRNAWNVVADCHERWHTPPRFFSIDVNPFAALISPITPAAVSPPPSS